MADKTIQKQLEQFMFDFDKADKDKSGCLSSSEVFGVLKSQGYTGTEEEAKVIFKEFDTDKNNSISRAEFQEAMGKLPKLSICEFYLRRMFKAIDQDGNGTLSRDEIRGAMDEHLVGLDIANSTVFELMTAQLHDKDGKLNYEEFLRAFKIESESQELRKIFTQLDKDKSGFLKKEEIESALRFDSELKLSVTKLVGLVIHLRTDADGKISYEEFIKLWQDECKK